MINKIPKGAYIPVPLCCFACCAFEYCWIYAGFKLLRMTETFLRGWILVVHSVCVLGNSAQMFGGSEEMQFSMFPDCLACFCNVAIAMMIQWQIICGLLFFYHCYVWANLDNLWPQSSHPRDSQQHTNELTKKFSWTLEVGGSQNETQKSSKYKLWSPKLRKIFHG